MNAIRKPEPRGACPGALRPMQSGDGLIVRVRPHAGALPVQSLMKLARAAARYGNGEIDLTRRANLQIRGLDTPGVEAMQEILGELGLLDASAEAESIRNILVGPLAGFESSELIDVRPVAHALERLLSEEARLWALPPKFGFLIDGGGALSLDGERADIRLRAIDRVTFALGVDTQDGIEWLGGVPASEAAAAAARAAVIFASSSEAARRARMSAASKEVRIEIARSLAVLADVPVARAANRSLGLLELGAKGVSAAFGIPFGRLSAGTARAIANAAHASGATEIFLSPWRALYVPLADRTMARSVLASAARLNLVTIDSDPIAAIDACPGCPACTSASVETRKAARRLAALLPSLGIASAHVSGCPKGCARSASADLVLVGRETDFAIVRNGRADGIPEAFVAWSLDDLSTKLRNLKHG